MGLNYGQLVDAVQLRCFAGQSLLETNIKTEINAVVTAIARGIYTDERGQRKVHYWNDLKTETESELAEDAWYIDLTNNRAVLKVRLSDSDDYYTTLIERSIEQADISTPYPATSAGRPSRYSMWGDKMIFDCKADEDYSVWTRRYLWPTDMSADANTPSITNIDDVIIARVTANIMAIRQGQDAAEAVYWLNEAQRLYIEAIMADANKQAVDGPVQFRPGGK